MVSSKFDKHMAKTPWVFETLDFLMTLISLHKEILYRLH